MGDVFLAIRKRLEKPWICGLSTNIALTIFDRYVAQIQALKIIYSSTPTVVISEKKPIFFSLSLLAGIASKACVVLLNPNLVYQQIKDLAERLKVDLILGDISWPSRSKAQKTKPQISTTILVATGGSGGHLHFAVHSWENVKNAVNGYVRFWQQDRISVVNVLPLYHVGGLAPLLRTFLTRGLVSLANWQKVRQANCPKLPSGYRQLSLVPTQLNTLIESPETCNWLKKFDKILIGGAKTHHTLVDKALSFDLSIACAYGMTETFGTIAICDTEELKAGKQFAKILPHLTIKIAKQEVWVKGGSVSYCYFPPKKSDPHWHHTKDKGCLDDHGNLKISGRLDDFIISGGENISPEKVKEALIETGLISEALVFGIADVKWGQKVIAFVIGRHRSLEESQLRNSLRNQLPAYMLPKNIIITDELPLTSMDKVDFSKLKDLSI